MRWWGNNLWGCGVKVFMQAEFFNLQLLSLLFECDLCVCPAGPHELLSTQKHNLQGSFCLLHLCPFHISLIKWFIFSYGSLCFHRPSFFLRSSVTDLSFLYFLSSFQTIFVFYFILSIFLFICFFSFITAVIKPGSNFHHLSFSLSSQTLNNKELLSSDGLLFTPPCFGCAVGALCLSLSVLLGPSLV